MKRNERIFSNRNQCKNEHDLPINNKSAIESTKKTNKKWRIYKINTNSAIK